MSFLQRSRSLRKPAEPPSKDSQPDPRKGSPSRLPIRPSAQSNSTTTNNNGAPAPARPSSRPGSRPASAGLRRSTSMKQPATASQQDPPPPKREANRYPPLSSSNRPPGPTARPTSSGAAAAQTKRVATHARAKSNVTTLSSATVLRPPSRDQARAAATGGTRSSHSRSASVDKSAGPATATATAMNTTQASQNAAQAQAKLRPAFSTLQQHYSPAKSHAPKPLTSAILAPPSPSKLPANVAASAETSRLQAELLQLHLLHRDAAGVTAQWHASAREKLGQRFAELGAESRDVADWERVRLERGNVLALRGWGDGGGLGEKIQTLESVVCGLWALSEPGGRYARVVRRFERWVDRLCDVEQARRDGVDALLQSHDSLFIGELDNTWRDEVAGLTRRLDGWRMDLREIDHVATSRQDGADKSSLARMLDGSRSLLHDMLAELATMETIEREASAREEGWIEEMNRLEEGEDDTQRAGAVWRTL